MGSYLLESVRLSSRREVAIVLFLCDCSQHIPSRGTTHPIGEQLCLVVADANLSVANSSPYSHSIQSNVRLAETVVCFSVAASRVAPRVGSYGRDLKRLVSRSDRTTVPNCLCRVSFLCRCCVDDGLLFLRRILVPVPLGPLRRAGEAQGAASARHSAYVFLFVSMCQMIVASFLITATRAMLAPRLRLIRLNHSRIRASLRNTF